MQAYGLAPADFDASISSVHGASVSLAVSQPPLASESQVTKSSYGSRPFHSSVSEMPAYHHRASKLAGWWYGEIIEGGKVIKRDEYKVEDVAYDDEDGCYELRITGRRVFPNGKSPRAWKCFAWFRHVLLCGIYKSVDPLADRMGSFVLEFDEDGDMLSGAYLKKDRRSNKFRKIEYRWRRKETHVTSRRKGRGTSETVHAPQKQRAPSKAPK
jgi:hypothetical protein